MKRALLIVLLALAALALVWLAAQRRWGAHTGELLTRLVSARSRVPRERFDPGSLAGLPAPVERYLRKVIPAGQPFVRRARFVQRGTILMTSKPDGWRPFRAIHTATAAPAGFVWDARVRVAPLLDALVRDAYVDGEGHMRASLAGLFPLVDVHGTPGIASAALLRWLAEAAWVPTALVPGQGVTWTALDDSSARASVGERGTTVSLDFHFGADSLVTRVYSPARDYMVQGRSVPTPWQARWLRWERCAGLLVPVSGEVEWLLPSGPELYWRGDLVEVRFEYE